MNIETVKTQLRVNGGQKPLVDGGDQLVYPGNERRAEEVQRTVNRGG
jgi:hypothetical protein